MKLFQWTPGPETNGEPAAHEWAEYNLPADFQSPALALPESERYPESAAVSSPISDDY
ncbi:MAG: hypothetical protein IPK20_21000 [Betaproteobacteria bacterium]|nr:hypothetical protein [Betaproteobacteria bacterium]